jgi:Ca-activated chloride channel family protein
MATAVRDISLNVMAGLVPAIHVLAAQQGREDVDARDKRGHDGREADSNRTKPALGPKRALSLLVALAAFCGVSVSALAEGEKAGPALVPKFVTPAQMHSGALLLKSTEDRYVEAPLLGTDVDLTVSGPTARARVSQIFFNPTDGWVEAVYVYPLPDGGAVDTLKMVVGDRVIIGEIKERVQARAAYEQAKAAGQKASLIEQERPNIFTNSVANIGPKETVVVQIEYQEPAHQSTGEFSLRVPLVVAPRYNPAPIVQSVDFRPTGQGRGQGWGTVSDPVPDRSRIEPPVLDPRINAPVNPVTITVRLQAGFPLGEVKSHHHNVNIDTVADDARVIKLADKVAPADRDFELTWKPASESAPAVGLFREHVGDADYLLAFVTPPVLPPSEEQRPREIVFVIDNSGSMGGTSILQAKASLAYALGRLKPSDRFNVIRFDHTMTVLFPDTVAADAEHVGQAKAFVAALQASGGTEMVPPMQAALTDPRGSEASTVRQVVFLTDGEIGNEQQLFDTISAMRGRSRLFMVGIGSAPNTFLMTRASELGRGSYTHIGSVEQVEERMKALFGKLESPAVTNLTATFSAAGADVSPVVLPDLYRGEPVALTAKVGALAGTLDVKGTIGDRPWIVTLPLADAAEGKGLSQLWARRKITDAEVGKTLGKLTSNEADARILSLALDHHLVTRLTSLVALDKTPSRPEGAHLTRTELPLNLPAGWEFDKVFGGEHAPVPATRRADNATLRDAQLAYASVVTVARAPQPSALRLAGSAAQPGVTLPRTATDAELRIWLGLFLCAIGFILGAIRLAFGRRGAFAPGLAR